MITDEVAAEAAVAGASYSAVCASALDEILAGTVHEKITAIARYYRSILPPDRLPGRQHVDPIDLGLLLPNVWLIDVIGRSQRRFSYRLMGTRLTKALNAEVTGRFLDEVHQDFDESPVRPALLDVVSARCPSYRAGRPLVWPRAALRSLQRLYLPLAHNGIDVDMILGLTVFVMGDGSEA